MKRSIFTIFCIVFFSLLTAQNNPPSATTSLLAKGNIYKIKVDKSGIFKITKKFLTDCGINANAG